MAADTFPKSGNVFLKVLMLLFIFLTETFQMFYAIFVPSAYSLFQPLAGKFSADTAENCSVALTAFKDITALFPHFNTFSAALDTALTFPRAEMLTARAVSSAGGKPIKIRAHTYASFLYFLIQVYQA